MKKVHVISETIIKGNGVYTAFMEHIELLRSSNKVEVVVNNEGRGDLLHSHSYSPYFILKGLKYKNRKILTVHVIPDSIKGSLPGWKYLMPFVKWYFKQIYSFADVCIAISPMVEDAILKTGAKTEVKLVSNPLPFEKWKSSVEKRRKGREILGISSNDFIILGVGQLESRKGIEDFLKIAESISEAKFVWVGGRPFGILTEGISKINKSIENCKSSNILFTGMLGLEQMPLIYAAADLMLFTSYQENCPLAPIEAAACGLPVIFRDIPEYKSLYQNPYLKAKDLDEFIKLTMKLINDKDFYNSVKEISNLLIKQFDKNYILDQLLNIYQVFFDKQNKN